MYGRVIKFQVKTSLCPPLQVSHQHCQTHALNQDVFLMARHRRTRQKTCDGYGSVGCHSICIGNSFIPAFPDTSNMKDVHTSTMIVSTSKNHCHKANRSTILAAPVCCLSPRHFKGCQGCGSTGSVPWNPGRILAAQPVMSGNTLILL